MSKMANLEAAFLGIVLLVSSAALAEAEYMKYKDPKWPVEERIRDLTKRMTLAEKIGQMAQIDRKYATPQIMKDYFIGKHSA